MLIRRRVMVFARKPRYNKLFAVYSSNVFFSFYYSYSVRLRFCIADTYYILIKCKYSEVLLLNNNSLSRRLYHQSSLLLVVFFLRKRVFNKKKKRIKMCKCVFFINCRAAFDTISDDISHRVGVDD